MAQNKKNIIRILAVALALILAAAIAFGLMPKLYKMESATERIVMLTQNVSAGTQITDNMIIETEVGSYGLSSSVIRDRNEVIGKYAAQNIYSKDLLFAEKFTSDYKEINKELDPETELGKNQMLLTIELSSIAAGGAGKILPGDIVKTAVYTGSEYSSVYDEAEENTPTVIFPESLQNLTVYRVRTAALQALDPSSTDAGSSNGRVPAYITLIVTQSQATELLQYSYQNVVHFIEVD